MDKLHADRTLPVEIIEQLYKDRYKITALMVAYETSEDEITTTDYSNMSLLNLVFMVEMFQAIKVIAMKGSLR